MERGDFISGEVWCKYKFERESKKEEIERLQRKVERASKNLHNFVFGIVSTMYVLGCSALISAKLILWHIPKYLVAIVMIGAASAVLREIWQALFERW